MTDRLPFQIETEQRLKRAIGEELFNFLENIERRKTMLIYDCEIIKAIEDKKHPKQEGIEYCSGWQDHKNMGLSCVCCYDYLTKRYRVFLEDGWDKLQHLFSTRRPLIGFNNIGFDNKLLRANGFIIPDDICYDILQQIWLADDLAPEFHYPSHIGYSLDATLKVNFPNLQKSGHGALAPILWQEGKTGQVIDYCLEDIRLTKKVLDKILRTGGLVNPIKSDVFLSIPRP